MPPSPPKPHTAAHRAKQGVSVGGGITTLGVRCVVRNLCARSGQKSILCHLCMDRGNVGEKQRAFGTETRTVRVSVPKAPRPRRVALLHCCFLRCTSELRGSLSLRRRAERKIC